MRDPLAIDDDPAPLADVIAGGLTRVTERFDRQLASDLPAVATLVAHIERYRGKMLRPTLVLACGLAAHPEAASARGPEEFGALLHDGHIAVAAVCEMVHMATLVHDDVLDEADTRRRGWTVNHLSGNEAAVMLGDYLIASAFHLCSTLPTTEAAEEVGRASVTMCAGELLQLSHRQDLALGERTYFDIVARKTGDLIRASCRLGARQSGASDAVADRLGRFGLNLGIAFQIQDDLLDLTGRESVLGKPVGKDLEKGKLTLPVIHHLAHADAGTRARTLARLRAAGESESSRGLPDVLESLRATGSIEASVRRAAALVEDARAQLADLPDSPPRRRLHAMADAVIRRNV
ncbi:MAG: polyprenyl synthetase family protein [Phycisphaerae bacterium]|nr:polyprenyl synthetase family protein [Phycisphaerae bacterium]